ALVIQRARNFTMRRQARLIPLLLSLNPFGFVQNDIGLLVPSQPLDRFRLFVCRPGYAKSHLKIFYYLIHRSSPLRRYWSWSQICSPCGGTAEPDRFALMSGDRCSP